MMEEHDYKNYPELSNTQLDEFGFTSPHRQITEDFYATVIKVHDGDTITLSVPWRDFDFPLRFLDIDSKEMNAGGEEARDWLKGQILDEEVKIEININNRVDKYGRLLGRVISRGMNMGEAELRLGLAIPFGKKQEGEIPNVYKDMSVSKWF